jgi:hypothetical protein
MQGQRLGCSGWVKKDYLSLVLAVFVPVITRVGVVYVFLLISYNFAGVTKTAKLTWTGGVWIKHPPGRWTT